MAAFRDVVAAPSSSTVRILIDSKEVALGTNPLKVDTDGDGLSDYAEAMSPIPSNPLLADSDRDGISDKIELLRGIDPTYNPTNSPTYVGYLPYYRSSATNWEWNLENVQLVWDHGAGALYPSVWKDDTLVSFAVRNTATNDWRTFGSHRAVRARSRRAADSTAERRRVAALATRRRVV